MVTEQWEKDGQAQSRTICDVEKVHFFGSKSDNGGNSEPTYKTNNAPKFEEIVDDDPLPF